jgi:hypothetical protein
MRLTSGQAGAQQAAPLPWLTREYGARGCDGGLKTAATKSKSQRARGDETFSWLASYQLLHGNVARDLGVELSRMRTVCADGED